MRVIFWSTSCWIFFLAYFEMMSNKKLLRSKLRNYMLFQKLVRYRSSRPEVFSGKAVLKICSKFTGEHSRSHSSISTLLKLQIKLRLNFIEIAVRYRCSPVKLLDLLRTRFSKNTSGQLLVKVPWEPCKFLELIFTRSFIKEPFFPTIKYRNYYLNY